MVLILAFRPLATRGLNSTQSGTLLSNVLTLFVGIMFIVTANEEDAAIRAGENFDPRERDIISALVFIANMLVMAIPGLNFLSDGRVVDKIVAKISDQFCNEEEKRKISDIMELCGNQGTSGAAGGPQTAGPLTGSPRLGPWPDSIGTGGDGPSNPLSAALAEPAFLRGDIATVAHGRTEDLHTDGPPQLPNRRLDLQTLRTWA
jgi:hypothetical protein